MTKQIRKSPDDPEYDKHAVERFWERVSGPDENGCRFWLVYKSIDGYGRFWYKDKVVNAHRFYYEVVLGNGKVSEGFELGHYCEEVGATCNHKHCVVHVRPMTRSENRLMDLSGERHPAARVPDRWIQPIVEFYKRNKGKITQKQIAAELTKYGFITDHRSVSNWLTGASRNNNREL